MSLVDIFQALSINFAKFGGVLLVVFESNQKLFTSPQLAKLY